MNKYRNILSFLLRQIHFRVKLLITKKQRTVLTVKVTDVDFFFTNYVGFTPEEDWKRQQTEDMIAHYIDSGLKSRLPDIYEACYKDEVLNIHNIPYALWETNNLIDHNHFYMHPELTLMNKQPQLDITSGNVITFQAYRENIEYYSMDDILMFISRMLKRTEEIKDINSEHGSIRHLLKKYRVLKSEGIDPLDMILFLVSYHKNESIDTIRLSEGEEEVLQTVRRYNEKLKSANRNKKIWRGSLNHEYQ